MQNQDFLRIPNRLNTNDKKPNMKIIKEPDSDTSVRLDILCKPLIENCKPHFHTCTAQNFRVVIRYQFFVIHNHNFARCRVIVNALRERAHQSFKIYGLVPCDI